MTLLQPQTGKVPVPHPGTLTQPYWDGCARGELLFQRCGVCGHATHTPAYLCSNCTAQDLTWEKSAGTGEIYSWTTVWRPQMPSFEVPYVAIIVNMDEGWQILSNLIGCEHDAVEIGMRVEVEFHEMEGGFTLPYFRSASDPV
ncbi:MAG TPA: Zn-ribbon domain-containing OB-fold protein [Acidimicrobiia bacterium]|nr:Zn-ribbon domain-containing OB-fold protein [Acidimicrobiia bacterium]